MGDVMPSDESFPAAVTPRAAGARAAGERAAEDLRLLRAYEPVLRFTRGELFLPMPVENYLAQCSLWRSAGPGPALGGGRGAAERVCAPGELTPARLAQIGAPSGPDLSLRFVQRSLSRRESRAWRRDSGRTRLATAGGSPEAGFYLRLYQFNGLRSPSRNFCRTTRASF